MARRGQEMTRAETFRKLHDGPGLLVLPNAWDACTACLVADLGAAAIATTSSGMAWSQGHRDGDRLPVDLHLAAVRNIVRAVELPVTVDIEGGYGADPASVQQVVARFIDAGAVGINLEDGQSAPDLACRKIEAAKAAGLRAGVDLFVNARTDVYLRGLAPGREVAETLDRAARYASAGCDGLFVPNLLDRGEIAAVRSGTGLPLNLMARPGLPPAAVLAGLGVRRLSTGAALVQAALGHVRTLAAAVLAGDIGRLFDDALPYATANAMFPDRAAAD